MDIEQPKQEHKLHWWMFVQTFIPWLLIVGFFVLINRYVDFRTLLSGLYDAAYLIIALGILVLMTASFMLALWRWYATTLYLDSLYLVYERGLLAKRISKVPLQEIASIDLQQSLFQRLIGSGDLIVDMRGSALLRVPDLDHPAEIQGAIMEIRRQRGS